MNPIASEVLEETKRFRAALPGLMEGYRGRWVVFRDGRVVGDYSTEDEAYQEAVRRFGAGGGYVVAPVVHVEPTPVTAGVLFGLP